MQANFRLFTYSFASLLGLFIWNQTPVSWASETQAPLFNYEAAYQQNHMCSPRNGHNLAALQIIDKIKIFEQEKTYDFLKYPVCNNSNNYLEDRLSVATFDEMSGKVFRNLLDKPFDDSELSPVCTFAALNHKGDVQYEDCSNSQSPSAKPCTSKKYHKLVHNSITQAAKCFQTDPKLLFSLYTTESWLQINAKPRGGTAQSIAQLMKPAIDHLNYPYSEDKVLAEQRKPKDERVPVSSPSESKIMKYLNHFQEKYNTSGSGVETQLDFECSQLISRLKNMDHLKGDKKSCVLSDKMSCGNCKNVKLQDQLIQEIFYSIAYKMLSVNHSLFTMRKNEIFFEQDYGNFFKGQASEDFYKNSLKKCMTKKENSNFDRENKKIKCSTQITKNFFIQSVTTVNQAGHYLKKQIEEELTQEVSNMNRIIATSFPQVSDIDQSKIQETFAKYPKYSETNPYFYKLKDDPYVKTFCPEVIDSFPQFSNYSDDKKQKKQRQTQQKKRYA